MEPQDRAWYRLPDGTRAQAREGKGISPWALVGADGLPLYCWPIPGAHPRTLARFVFEFPAGYRIVPTDLKVDDLTPEPLRSQRRHRVLSLPGQLFSDEDLVDLVALDVLSFDDVLLIDNVPAWVLEEALLLAPRRPRRY